MLLFVPIWRFLPHPQEDDAAQQMQLTWSGTPQDLPNISLPGPAPKPSPAATAAKMPAPRGADAFHPRQTILSEPVHLTHPRQTLIQPDAPAAPPKIEPQLPNMVQWPVQAAPAKPQLQIAPSASAPQMKRRVVSSDAAPEIANNEKNPGLLNIPSVTNPAERPKMPIAPMSAAAPRKTQADASAPAAPEIAEAPGSLRL